MKCLDAEHAVADLNGSRLEVSTLLTPQAKAGDWVLLHTGFAIQQLTAAAARRLLQEASVWSNGGGPEASDAQPVAEGVTP